MCAYLYLLGKAPAKALSWFMGRTQWNPAPTTADGVVEPHPTPTRLTVFQDDDDY
jgi:hypothetical protein